MASWADLAALAEQLAGEGSKLKKRAAIAQALQRVVAADGPAEAGRLCLFLAGQPFAEADPRKLQAGGAMLSRAVKEVTGAADSALSAAYRRHGDLGAATCDLLRQAHLAHPAPTLTLSALTEAFDSMARARTTAARAATVADLLRRSSPLEAKYLVKLMLGDMRIGVKQSLGEEAIAEAASAPVAAVRHAVMLEADLSRAVERAFTGTLAQARLRLFHPLGFMLASPVDSAEEAVQRFAAKASIPAQKHPKTRKKTQKSTQISPENAAEQGLAGDIEAEAAALSAPESPGVHALLEDKFDGIRAQLHCANPEHPERVTIYSRNREDITESFPELSEAFSKILFPDRTARSKPLISENIPPAESLIFDGEILGWDLEANRALPFSVLGQRIGRKRVDDSIRRAIPVVFMAFDLMSQAGELLLPLPLGERRARLESVVGQLRETTVSALSKQKIQNGLFDGDDVVSESVERLRLSPVQQAETAEAIDGAYRAARARGNEGVMIKAVGSPYLPGRRGLAWLKLKRELATLDVVITGAEFGNGRRAQVLSDYTFAVRDEGGELLNVGKAYSGLTDIEIAEMTEWLKAHTLEDHGHFRTVEPIRVLEVAFNNIMRSDRHASGFALRFPRIVRIRDDKPVQEIDTLERVEEVYQSQPDKGGE